MLNVKELQKQLEHVFTNSDVSIIDEVGDGHHFHAKIVSDLFLDKTLVQRQQMVYEALGSIVGKEMHALSLDTKTFAEEKGELTESPHHAENENGVELNSDILRKIHKAVNTYDVVLFMKGSKDFPMCGFSSVASQILQKLNTEFVDINVLESDEIRENIKLYSNWPTIPQLYVKGKFVGGSDIMQLMYEDGSLETLLKQHSLIK